jgi:hypothetical protein
MIVPRLLPVEAVEWIPGAKRYPSFWGLMHAEREAFLADSGQV